MAAGAGLGVANLYYGQSLYPAMAASVGVPGERMGVVNALFQGGYALGMLLFVPLGDAVGKRGLVVAMLLSVAAAMLGLAAAPNFAALAAAALAVGVTTVVPQILVPFAAGLAAPEERGRVVGSVMGGLLLGILLSRTASGLVGGWLGSWRAVYVLAAALMAALAAVLRALLPPGEPKGGGLSYPDLMRSLVRLLRDEPVLRQSCLFGSLAFGAFSAFWTTLALLLAGPPYGYGPERAGLFGVAGAAGALAAPLVGRAADLRGPRRTIGLGLGITLVSFLVLLPGGGSLAALLAGVVLLDVGVQGSHISNQSRIYALPAAAHSRLNTVYMVTFFLGGAAGSALGAAGWQRWGWPGVCGVGLAFGAAALAAYFGTGGGRDRAAGRPGAGEREAEPPGGRGSCRAGGARGSAGASPSHNAARQEPRPPGNTDRPT
jgi:predicted MFS family arabinose efflux permease